MDQQMYKLKSTFNGRMNGTTVVWVFLWNVFMNFYISTYTADFIYINVFRMRLDFVDLLGKIATVLSNLQISGKY